MTEEQSLEAVERGERENGVLDKLSDTRVDFAIYYTDDKEPVIVLYPPPCIGNTYSGFSINQKTSAGRRREIFTEHNLHVFYKTIENAIAHLEKSRQEAHL